MTKPRVFGGRQIEGQEKMKLCEYEDNHLRFRQAEELSASIDELERAKAMIPDLPEHASMACSFTVHLGNLGPPFKTFTARIGCVSREHLESIIKEQIALLGTQFKNL